MNKTNVISKAKQLAFSPLVFFAVMTGTVFLVLGYVVCCAWISYSAQEMCINAKRQYAGDCVDALITQVQDENVSFHDRNDTIWALGQIGDARALPVIEKMYTGDLNHTKYDTEISQYELSKAVRLLHGETNITWFVRPKVQM